MLIERMKPQRRHSNMQKNYFACRGENLVNFFAIQTIKKVIIFFFASVEADKPEEARKVVMTWTCSYLWYLLVLVAQPKCDNKKKQNSKVVSSVMLLNSNHSLVMTFTCHFLYWWF